MAKIRMACAWGFFLLVLILCNEVVSVDGRRHLKRSNTAKKNSLKARAGGSERVVILFTEGRQLKAMGKDEYNSMQAINLNQNPEGEGLGYDLPAPHASHVHIIDHSVTEKKDPPQTTTLNQSRVFGDSVAVRDGSRITTLGGQIYKDDFRPTTPGSSPGVGHLFSGQKADAPTNSKSNGTGISHSAADNTDDFRPTLPGHIPGIEHSFQNTNAEQNP